MNNTILMSCWAKPLRNGKQNAKNPTKEWWLELIKLLKEKGYSVTQCGQGKEEKLEGADEHIWDLDVWLLGEKIKECVGWVSVDNFFHHWALLQFQRPGVVIWSQSDPEIFGHAKNINLLKDKKYLRAKQFELWEAAEHNPESFVSPEVVVEAVEKLVSENNK
jgi:ADP-heptose:LPS heptosyltransferase